MLSIDTWIAMWLFRCDKADDVIASSSEIKSLALSIEEEMFKHFRDTDAKYKSKYRSLIFNIKDQKNKVRFVANELCVAYKNIVV